MPLCRSILLFGCAASAEMWDSQLFSLPLPWSADGQGAGSPTEESFDLAEEGVAAERAASMRVQPEGRQRFVAQHVDERLAPV